MGYRVLFCGTPNFALKPLEHLFENPLYSLEGVLSQPDRQAGRGKKFHGSPVKNLALSKGCPVFTPEKARDPDFIQELAQKNFDLAIVVAYGQILPQTFLDLFPKGCFNIHGSLLPRWRGAAPIQRALMNGDRESGVCIQKMVFKLDAGDVIGERKVFLPPEMGAMRLYEELSSLGAAMLGSELPAFLSGKVAAVSQDESLVTYAAKIDKEEACIQWSQGAQDIQNKIRGLNMGPHAYGWFRGKKMKIHQAVAVPEGELGAPEQAPGTIVEIVKDNFVVATGQGHLRVLRVQPESKPQMSAGDFLRGLQVQKGDGFESNL